MTLTKFVIDNNLLCVWFRARVLNPWSADPWGPWQAAGGP